MGKSSDWIPGRHWEFKRRILLDHRAALDITHPLKICSGIFNVPSFGGAEMNQMLLEMKKGRQPEVEFNVGSLQGGAKRVCGGGAEGEGGWRITDLGESRFIYL